MSLVLLALGKPQVRALPGDGSESVKACEFLTHPINYLPMLMNRPHIRFSHDARFNRPESDRLLHFAADWQFASCSEAVANFSKVSGREACNCLDHKISVSARSNYMRTQEDILFPFMAADRGKYSRCSSSALTQLIQMTV
jgi:hypothetical protein